MAQQEIWMGWRKGIEGWLLWVWAWDRPSNKKDFMNNHGNLQSEEGESKSAKASEHRMSLQPTDNRYLIMR